jgi:hypothetical protein
MLADPKYNLTICSFNRRTPGGNKAKSPLKIKPGDRFTVRKRFISTSAAYHGTAVLELLDWTKAGYVFYAPEHDFNLTGKEI